MGFLKFMAFQAPFAGNVDESGDLLSVSAISSDHNRPDVLRTTIVNLCKPCAHEQLSGEKFRNTVNRSQMGTHHRCALKRTTDQFKIN